MTTPTCPLQAAVRTWADAHRARAAKGLAELRAMVVEAADAVEAAGGDAAPSRELAADLEADLTELREGA